MKFNVINLINQRRAAQYNESRKETSKISSNPRKHTRGHGPKNQEKGGWETYSNLTKKPAAPEHKPKKVKEDGLKGWSWRKVAWRQNETFRDYTYQHQYKTSGICYRTPGHRKKRDAANVPVEGYNIGLVRQLATRVSAHGRRKEPNAAKGRILRRRIKDEREATNRRQDESP